MLTKPQIRKKLKLLGVEGGDTLFVHSAFSSVGEVQGGAEGFLNTLCEAVGEGGTLVFPTFTEPGEPFSRKNSPSTTGVLSELTRKRNGSRRSAHPTHSVAAIGRNADIFACDDMILHTTCGEGTVFARLAQRGAKILMLGVDMNRCTFLHACEDDAGLDYLVESYPVAPPEGFSGEVLVRKFPLGHRAFIELTPLLREQPWFVQGFIGDALCSVFPARELREFCLALLKRDPFVFLCHNPACNSCMQMRGIVFDRGDCCTDPVCEVCRLPQKEAMV